MIVRRLFALGAILLSIVAGITPAPTQQLGVGLSVPAVATRWRVGGVAQTAMPTGLFMRMSAPISMAAASGGSSVATWTDIQCGSGGTGTCVQFTGAAGKNCTVVSNAFGAGKNGVRCTGGQYMTAARAGTASALAAAADTRIFSVYIVATNVTATSTGGIFAASGGGNSFLYIANGSVVGRFNGDVKTGSVPWTGSGYIAWGGSSTTDKSGGSGQGANAGLERIYARGGVVAANVAAVPTTGTSDFAIGGTATGALSGSATIAEILFFTRQLSPVEYIQLEKWADEQYGQSYPWAGKEYVVFLGNSHTMGTGATYASADFPLQVAALRGLGLGQYSNLGIGGITWNDSNAAAAQGGQMLARLSTDVYGTTAALGNAQVKYVVGEYYNSKLYSETGAQIAANAKLYLQALRTEAPAAKIALWTSFAFLNSSGGSRLDYDNYWDVAGNRTGLMDAYIPIHTDTNLGIDGAANTPLTAYWTCTGCANEGIHPSGQPGYPTTVSGYAYFASIVQAILASAGF